MRVRHGWSGEVKPNVWAKLDVELEEEDLRRILTSAGLPEAVASVGTATAFQLLEGEAELMLLAKLIASHGYQEGHGKMLALKERKAKILEQLKDRKLKVAA